MDQGLENIMGNSHGMIAHIQKLQEMNNLSLLLSQISCATGLCCGYHVRCYVWLPLLALFSPKGVPASSIIQHTSNIAPSDSYGIISVKHAIFKNLMYANYPPPHTHTHTFSYYMILLFYAYPIIELYWCLYWCLWYHSMEYHLLFWWYCRGS